MNVALVTCSAVAGLTVDDRCLFEPFRARGVRTPVVVWEDPYVDWSEFDAVVVRSTWDYAYRVNDFLDWVTVVSNTTRLLNPAPMLTEYAHKGYLMRLAGQGIPTVPTILIGGGSDADLDEIMAEAGWSEAVVKPAVGSFARHIYRLAHEGGESSRELIERIQAAEDLMVQPFIESVVSQGEASLVYVDGVFTHAAFKRVGDAGLFVQEEMGGSTDIYQPTDAEMEVGQSVMDVLDESPLYARVDLMRSDNGPLVSELEVVEPELFFRFSAAAADAFVNAVVASVEG